MILDIATLGGACTEMFQFLTLDQATAALVPRRLHRSPEVEWAASRRIGIALDGWHVPLATAQPKLLGEFEAKHARPGQGLTLETEPRLVRLSAGGAGRRAATRRDG